MTFVLSILHYRVDKHVSLVIESRSISIDCMRTAVHNTMYGTFSKWDGAHGCVHNLQSKHLKSVCECLVNKLLDWTYPPVCGHTVTRRTVTTSLCTESSPPVPTRLFQIFSARTQYCTSPRKSAQSRTFVCHIKHR